MNIRKNKYEIVFLFVLLSLIFIPVVRADTSFFYGQFVDRASSDDGSYTLKSMENNSIYLFENGNREPTWSYNIIGNIWSVSISHNGKYVAVGSDGGLIWLFDQKGTVVWNKTFGNAGIRSIEFTKDSQFIDASNFINQAFFINLNGNVVSRPVTHTTSKTLSTQTQIPSNLGIPGIDSVLKNNLNLLILIFFTACLICIVWYAASKWHYRKKGIFSSIGDSVTLKNFAIFAVVLIVIGFLPNYYSLKEYSGFFQTFFKIGVFCLLLAYFLYAVKCWEMRSQICAIFMVSIPMFAYYLATSKIPSTTTNILIYLGILLCLNVAISAILLFVSDNVKKRVEGNFKAFHYSRYFEPQMTYALSGLLIVSIVAVNAGSSVIFSNNSNFIFSSIQKILPEEYKNYQEPISSNPNTYSNLVTIKQSYNPTKQYVVTRTPTQTLSTQYTSLENSKKYLDYINTIRAKNGVNTLQFDARVYRIALARVNDMDQYGYLDHTNPQTGTCPDSIKTQYGLSSNEYVAENGYAYSSSTGINYHNGIEKDAIDSWMTSRGHRYNLLYPHTGGAVACSKGGHCVFLGLNRDRFGSGCYTAAEGMAYWNSASRQPNEI